MLAMQQHIKNRINKINKGEIPKGYRKSKFGIVPEDWEDIKFSSIFEEIDNRTSDVQNYQLYSLTIEEGVTPKTERYERSHLLKKAEDYYKIVTKDNFVYNPMNVRLGALARFKLDKEVCVSAYYNVFKIKNDFNPVFFEAYLKSYRMMYIYNSISTGSLKEKQRVHFSQFLRLELPIPSEAECDKIAEILSTWDKAISLKQELIEQNKEQKKDLIQKLLKEKGDWKETKLSKFLIATPREVDKPKENFLALGVRSHCKGTFQKPDFDPNTIEMTTLYEVKENDLIVNITFAWEGAIAIVKKEDEGALVSHRFPTYVFNTDLVIPEYFKYVITTKRFRYFLGLYSPGGAGRNRVLSKKDLLKHKMSIPPLMEQYKIAEILTTADNEIGLLEAELEQLKEQKKGLMQLLLTGKLRVNENLSNEQ